MTCRRAGNECAQKSGAYILAFDFQGGTSDKSTDKAGNQTRFARHREGDEAGQHGRKQFEGRSTYRENVLYIPRALSWIRSAVVVI